MNDIPKNLRVTGIIQSIVAIITFSRPGRHCWCRWIALAVVAIATMETDASDPNDKHIGSDEQHKCYTHTQAPMFQRYSCFCAGRCASTPLYDGPIKFLSRHSSWRFPICVAANTAVVTELHIHTRQRHLSVRRRDHDAKARSHAHAARPNSYGSHF